MGKEGNKISIKLNLNYLNKYVSKGTTLYVEGMTVQAGAGAGVQKKGKSNLKFHCNFPDAIYLPLDKNLSHFFPGATIELNLKLKVK